MKFLIRLLLLVLPLAAAAQSQLPPCPVARNAYWHSCFGTHTFASGNRYVGEFRDGKAHGQGTITFANGDKHVGEFRDGKYHGQGIEYRANGTISRSGQWVDGGLAQPFAIDRSRFPFHGSPQVAGSSVDTGRAERDRLAAEAEAAQRQQRELEQRQAAERQRQAAEAEAARRKQQLDPLRACQGKLPTSSWTNCVGTHVLPWGDVYVGEYMGGARNGEGIEYRPNGGISRSGRWDYNTLGQSYPIDVRRFPLSGQAQANAIADPGRAERDRLAAEAEAAQRRQQELEQRLAAERDRQAAEAEATRRKQQDLEQRLATEARERERQAAEADAARLRQQELEQRLTAAARERERQTAEAEAARRKQQELEQRLVTEARERARQAAEADVARLRQIELEQRLATEGREREKQAAEVEAVRRRQQELEAQLAALQSQSALRPPNQAAFSRNQRRVALVIGNAQYKVSPLDNPVNDATDMDRTLKQLGFQTTLLRNATLGQMREATRRFADQLQSADVALIYFAGHGVESNRKNYMIPVNADLKFEYELDDQAYNAAQWLDMLESIKSSNAERVNIVILDACRNNSLIGARSLGRGLGRMDAPTGTFLAYSTAPGKVAADGARGERNSPFTRHLLTVMQQPGLPIEEAFKEVRRNVSRETNGAQVPWESTSLTGFFTFRQTR